MKLLKMHKYIFGLAIFASIVSLSGYAKNIEFPNTTTEWVYTESSESSIAEQFAYFKNIAHQKQNLNNYYEFNFKCFLYQYNDIYNLNYKTLKHKWLEFKNNILMLESRIITLSIQTRLIISS